ncbi:MAG TPA: patatin-like phospholipase family protein, partial [Geminicoccaceae bacterium]
LERLLEEPDFQVDALSGTSAGALNAVTLASGLLSGGRDGARAALRGLWQDVADLGRLASARQGVLPQLALDLTAQVLSPYQLNPLGLNPLREVLARRVDFAALQRAGTPSVLVAATAVASGEPVLFQGSRLTAEAVLASACLPQIHQAVEIDGAAYWDGGYSSNPPLLPLVMSNDTRDLLLIQINPSVSEALPRTVHEIRNRIGELVFGRPLEQDLRALEAHRRRSRFLSALDRQPGRRRLARHRLHRIDGSPELATLHPRTKLMPDPASLDDLRARGRRAAEAWLTGVRGGRAGVGGSPVAPSAAAPRAA